MIQKPLLLGWLVLGTLAFSGIIHGQSIKFDGSIGIHDDLDLSGDLSADELTLTGPLYEILKARGEEVGANLFHSFESFNLDNLESANFETDGVNNVLTRVTGGAPSSINGAINAGANLFFMNPNGVIFGNGASLNITGAFTATTADRMTLQGGGTFAATASALPATVTGKVASFGFLGPNSAITLNGVNWGAGSADSIHLLGGSVQITDSTIAPTSGRTNLVAAPPGATTTLDVTNPPSLPVINLTLPETASVTLNGAIGSNVSSTSGGNVVIRGGKLTVEGGSSITSTDFATGRGGDIDIQVSGPAIVNGAITSTANSGNGGGNIFIDAGSDITIQSTPTMPGVVESVTHSAQPGGNIQLTASGNLNVIGDASPATISTQTTLSGAGGTLTLNAANLSVTNGGLIQSSTSGSGPGGAIGITTIGDVAIDGAGSSIVTETSGMASAAGGTLTINADGLELTNGGSILSETSNAGIGGNIAIFADTVSVSGANSFLGTQSTGSAPGGSLNLTAATSVTASADGKIGTSGVNSDGGAVTINAPEITVDGGNITTLTTGAGTGGDVSLLAADQFTLNSGTVNTTTESTGDGGLIEIGRSLARVGKVNFNGGTFSSIGLNTGIGGDLSIFASTDASQGIADARFEMAGGTISSSALGSSSVDGTDPSSGGNITISGGTISIGAAASIQSEATRNDLNRVRAGTIHFQAVATEIAGNVTTTRVLNPEAGEDFLVGDAPDILFRDVNGVDSDQTSVHITGAVQVGPNDFGNISFGNAPVTGKAEGGEYIASRVGPNDVLFLNLPDVLSLTSTGYVGGEPALRAVGKEILLTNPTSIPGKPNFIIEADTSISIDGGINFGTAFPDTEIGDITFRTGTFTVPKTQGFTTGTPSDHDASSIAIFANSVELLGPISSKTTGAGSAGDIFVQTGSLNVTGSRGFILARGEDPSNRLPDGVGNGGSITIHVSKADHSDPNASSAGTISLDGGQISTFSVKGTGGDIAITADTLLMQDFAKISTTTQGIGDAGDITIEVNDLRLFNRSRSIKSNSAGSKTGNAGDLTIKASNEINLDGRSLTQTISSATLNQGKGGDVILEAPRITISSIEVSARGGIGPAGSIEIRTDELHLNENGFLFSDSRSNGPEGRQFGDAGNITIRGLSQPAAQSVIVDGTINSRTRSTGNAGNISINANHAEVRGTVLSTSEVVVQNISLGQVSGEFDSGAAFLEELGYTILDPTDFRLERIDSALRIEELENSGVVDSSTALSGVAVIEKLAEFGAVDTSEAINAINAELANPGGFHNNPEFAGRQLNSFTATEVLIALQYERIRELAKRIVEPNWGNAGSIHISGGRLDVSGSIDTQTETSGTSGTVALNVGELNLAPTGEIRSLTTGEYVPDGELAGNAGRIDIVANTANLMGAIDSRTEGEGQAGVVTLSGNQLTISKGGFVTSQTLGSGNAGQVNFTGNIITFSDGGFSTTQTASRGRAGTVSIRGREVNISSGGFVTSETKTAADAGDILIGTSALNISSGGFLTTRTSGPGNAGTINITTDALAITGNGSVSSTTSGAGDAGSVSVTANAVNLGGGASLSATTSGSGQGGNVAVDASDMLIDGGVIEAQAQSTGSAGSIDLAVASFLTVRNGGRVSATTSGSGHGGSITVQGNTIAVDSAGRISAEAAGSGDAGTLGITAATLTVQNGGGVSGTTSGTGQGGTVTVQTSGNTTLRNRGRIEAETRGSGNAGSVSLAAGNLFMNSGAGVSATTLGSGSSGNITVSARDRVLLQGGAGIEAVSRGRGNAGNIRLNAKQIAMSSGGNVSATTLHSGQGGSVQVGANRITMTGNGSGIEAQTAGSGRAGNINVRSLTDLNIFNGSSIRGSTSGSGRGGDITATVRDINISGSGAGIFAESTGSGNAGSIDLNVTGRNTLRLSNNGTISSRSAGAGNAGSIDIDSVGNIILSSGSSINVESLLTNAGSIFLDGGSNLLLDSSSITARAGQNAGNIEIRVPDTIRLDNSQIIAEAGSDGGNIIIDDARFLLLNNSILSANAILGTGGFIQIGSDVLFQNNSSITASSDFGTDGEVRIDALSDLSAAQAALDAALLDSSNDLQERCTIKIPGQRNSFILVGRGGLPVMPGRFLPGHQLLELPKTP